MNLAEKYGETMSKKEVAALFKVSQHTVSRWAKNSKFPKGFLHRGKRLFPTSEIAEYLKQLQKNED